MNNIQKYRGLKNISQKDFAAQLKMTRSGLSFIENGHVKNIDPSKLEEISRILDVSIVKLLGMENFKYIPGTKEDIDYLIELLEAEKEKL